MKRQPEATGPSDESLLAGIRDVARHVIAAIQPEALARLSFARIAGYALGTQVHFGPEDSSLETAACIILGIRNALRDQAEEVGRAASLDAALSIILDGVRAEMDGLRGLRFADDVAGAFSKSVDEHPSCLDTMIYGLTPPFQTIDAAAESALRRTLVRVYNRDEGCVGTGFSVGAGTHVVTAHHVTTKGRSLEVAFSAQQGSRAAWTGSAELVGGSPELDVAILQIADPAAVLEAGLTPVGADRLSLANADELRGHSMLALGYHADSVPTGAAILDPCVSISRVVSYFPIRRVGFEDGKEQECLVLVAREGEETIRTGMSGGPLVDLETGHVVAMTCGAQATRVRQFNGRYEQLGGDPLPTAEYGFGVLLADVATRCPELRAWCGLD